MIMPMITENGPQENTAIMNELASAESKITNLTSQLITKENLVTKLTNELSLIKSSRKYKFALMLSSIINNLLPRSWAIRSFLESAYEKFIILYRGLNKGDDTLSLIGQTYNLEKAKIAKSISSLADVKKIAFPRVKHPKVSIIILNHNGLDYMKRCLATVAKNTNFKNYEVIVVDNGSCDGSVEYIQKNVKNVKLIKNSSNLGFSKANNIAIRATEDSDILLLNNDTLVFQKDWLDKIYNCAQNRTDIGIVGCRLLNQWGDLLHAGTYIYPETYWGQQIGGNEKEANQYFTDREVEGVVFACAYIKREVLKKIGLLDEDYFAYFEDTDYCLKAREHGFKIFCCGAATLIHYQNTSCRINSQSFEAIFNESRSIFIKKWQNSIENKYTHDLSWKSILKPGTGYGASSKSIILGLEKNSVKINYKYTYGPGTPFPLDEKPMTDNYIMNIVLQRQSKPSKVEVSYCQGDAFFKNSGKYKIGYTMLEITGLPKEWVNQANMMNEVWVPSEFNKMTFIQSGVKVPIYTMPLGIDENYFNPHIKPFKKSGKYTFLSVFEWSERKAPEILFNAYSKAFSKKDNVMLICKIANVNSDVNVYEEIEKMNLPEKMADFELLYNVYLQDYDMARLYRTADCFVLPTRGEGWGMPITEAMSCGLPVIATDWSAHKDYMDNSNAYPINVKRLIPAEAKCPYYKGFQWAEPDEEHLIYLMRHVFTQQDESARKGLKAHNEIAAKYTWDHTAKRVIDRIKNI